MKVGPLINERAVARVAAMLDDAVAKGATVVCGGQRVRPRDLYIQPTILRDVAPGMEVHDGEIFGPIVAISTFSDEAAIVKRANDTPAGLAAYFFTEDPRRQWRVSEALDYGMVGVNSGAMSNEMAPFGGYKTSGLGREGGRTGITPYLEEKYVLFGNMA
jgi:succinate-semialdehyde dehydrogenase/glutarate-semialdehyde dehydrogenase